MKIICGNNYYALSGRISQCVAFFPNALHSSPNAVHWAGLLCPFRAHFPKNNYFFIAYFFLL